MSKQTAPKCFLYVRTKDNFKYMREFPLEAQQQKICKQAKGGWSVIERKYDEPQTQYNPHT